VINVLVTVAFLVSALCVVTAGSRRIAGLLALTGATWWLGDVVPQAALLHRGPLVHLLLAYPEGRVERRYERIVVAVAYVTGAWVEAGSAPAVTLATGVAVVVCTLQRSARAEGASRRARAGPAVAGTTIATVLAVGAAGRLLDADVDVEVLRAYELALIATAAGLAADLRFGEWSAAAVAGLVIELGSEGDQSLSARLGRALGDLTLLVAYPLEPGRGYVDEQGREVSVGEDDANRVATPIRRDGQELAVVVHDRALLKVPRLLEDVVGALTVALANAQMQGELRLRVAAVEASRRRLVTAAEAERRHFGERLRGSAEWHLDAAEQALTAEGDRAGSLATELRSVRTDIQTLAEGLHPAALVHGGLDGALAALATSSTISVEVVARTGQRLPPAVEGAAWFVCSEALANVAKHSAASCAHVRVARRDGVLHIEISDDGRGGADPARGSGLRGLAERVEALGGRLWVAERLGGGTVVAAELPAP
jgi:signal transduction histidine kinase